MIKTEDYLTAAAQWNLQDRQLQFISEIIQSTLLHIRVDKIHALYDYRLPSSFGN